MYNRLHAVKFPILPCRRGRTTKDRTWVPLRKNIYILLDTIPGKQNFSNNKKGAKLPHVALLEDGLGHGCDPMCRSKVIDHRADRRFDRRPARSRADNQINR